MKWKVSYKKEQEEMVVIRKFIDNPHKSDEETKLALTIMDFLFDWMLNRKHKRDAHFYKNLKTAITLIERK